VRTEEILTQFFLCILKFRVATGTTGMKEPMSHECGEGLGLYAMSQRLILWTCFLRAAEKTGQANPAGMSHRNFPQVSVSPPMCKVEKFLTPVSKWMVIKKR
jgi:hypothetical protein